MNTNKLNSSRKTDKFPIVRIIAANWRRKLGINRTTLTSRKSRKVRMTDKLEFSPLLLMSFLNISTKLNFKLLVLRPITFRHRKKHQQYLRTTIIASKIFKGSFKYFRPSPIILRIISIAKTIENIMLVYSTNKVNSCG